MSGKIKSLLYIAMQRYPGFIQSIIKKEVDNIINEFFKIIIESRIKTMNKNKSIINIMHQAIRNVIKNDYGVFRTSNKYKTTHYTLKPP